MNEDKFEEKFKKASEDFWKTIEESGQPHSKSIVKNGLESIKECLKGILFPTGKDSK